MDYNELEPKIVFQYFKEISNIPHGSGNTEEISKYLMNFAKEHNLKAIYDSGRNIIIFKDGTKGFENSEPIILQGHMDMVCDKVPDCTIDMSKEGLTLCTNGEYLWADGTTLGGDDGIAVAYILAILASDDIPHPPIEAVITRDEEIGLLGAAELETSYLKGKRLINIDSEDEGIFTAGCAGAMIYTANIPTEFENSDNNTLRIEISGLTGGHSGIDIGKQRKNAIKLLAKILQELSQNCDFYICDINGGVRENVIPKQAYAVICIEDTSKLKDIIKNIKSELINTEKDLKITFSETEISKKLSKQSTEKIITFLTNTKSTALKFNNKNEVLTSLNLGVVSLADNTFQASFMIRSNLKNEKEQQSDILDELVLSLGGSFEHSASYPAWEYAENSKLRETMTAVFERLYDRTPKIETIHAGLECGIIADKINNLDAVSIGPNILEIHTPNEKLDIASTKRTWKFLIEILNPLCYNNQKRYKGKNMNRKELIYMGIIIIFIISVIAVAWVLISSNKEEKNNTNISSRTQEELKKEFNNMFNNKIDFSNYNTDGIQKLDDTKDIVYTTYELERTENEKYEVDLHLPCINIKGEVPSEFNQITQKVFADKANSIFQNAKTYTIYSINYTGFINGDILSVVIKSNLKEGSNAQRTIVETYNLNLKTNQEVTIDEVIAQKSITKEEVESKVKQDVTKAIQDANKIQVSGYETFKRNIDSDEYKFENLTNFYLKDNGKMYIVFAYGNLNFTSEMDIIEI